MAAPYTEQKDHLDYAKVGDTGQDNIDAISPITDGEPATQTTFRRPSENLRERTEDLRQFSEETLYYRDAQHLSVSSPGTITWEGTVLDGGTGKIVQSDTIVIKPFLTPRADTKSSISIGVAATNEITYTVSGFSTERMNQVFIEHYDAGVSAVLTVTISDGPVKRIRVIFDSSNTAHDAAAVKAIVDTAIFGDADLTGKIVTSINAIALIPIAVQAETRFEGTFEAEEHRIAGGVLDAVTMADPLQAGDTIAIWYRYLIDPGGGFDGRRESTSIHGTNNVPQAALFITSLEPNKIPGAIPLCTVTGNTNSPGTQLVFIDGTVFNKNDVFMLGSTSAESIAYDGGPTWADLSTNPATTVEGQLDKILNDLGQGIAGTAKISSDALVASAPGNDAIGVSALFTQLQGLLDLINKRADLTETAGQSFAGQLELTKTLNFKHADSPLGVTPRLFNDEATPVARILLLKSIAVGSRYMRLYFGGSNLLEITYNAEWDGTNWIPDSTSSVATRKVFGTTGSPTGITLQRIPNPVPVSWADSDWLTTQEGGISHADITLGRDGVHQKSSEYTKGLLLASSSADDDSTDGDTFKLLAKFKAAASGSPQYVRIYSIDGTGTTLSGLHGIAFTTNAEWIGAPTKKWSADDTTKGATVLRLYSSATVGPLQFLYKKTTTTDWSDTSWNDAPDAISTELGSPRIAGHYQYADTRSIISTSYGATIKGVHYDTASFTAIPSFNGVAWSGTGGPGTYYTMYIPIHVAQGHTLRRVRADVTPAAGGSMTLTVYKYTKTSFGSSPTVAQLGAIDASSGLLRQVLSTGTFSETVDVEDESIVARIILNQGGNGDTFHGIEVWIDAPHVVEHIAGA